MPRNAKGKDKLHVPNNTVPGHDVAAAFAAVWGLHLPHVKPILRVLQTTAITSLRNPTLDPALFYEYGRPKLTSSLHCWDNAQPPSPSAVARTVLKACPNNGHKADMLAYLATIHSSTGDDNPRLRLMNVNITGSDVGQRFRIPAEQLSARPSALVDSPIQANFSLEDTAVEPHVDGGTSGLSLVLPPCEKVWCFFPPTERNMVRLQNLNLATREAKKDWSGFEHGMIGLVGHAEAVYIPSGWIHATITIKPGILFGATFYEQGSARMAAKCLLMDLVEDRIYGRNSPDDDSVAVINFSTYFVNCLIAGLCAPDADLVERAMQAYLEVEGALREAVLDGAVSQSDAERARSQVQKTLTVRLKDVIRRHKGRKQCPRHPNAAFDLRHWMDEHVRKPFRRAEPNAEERDGSEVGI